MRSSIVHEGAVNINYEIRHIVEVGNRLIKSGRSMTWENIGDPIQMGEKVAPWIRAVVRDLLEQEVAWAYCHSRGILETREFLAGEVNKRGGAQVTADDILFVNGIADAVDKIYDLIRKDARVVMPSPSYSTHLSNESKRGSYENITFPLDPQNGWRPDLDELRNLVKYNPQVVAVALVNPDNPTGMVYAESELREMVAIAAKYGLFIICDEIYTHLNFTGKARHLSEIIGDVPAIALRGISKEYPWPGARCGWIEILNARKHPAFAEYVKALGTAKMLEVCATTLPQMSIPLVFGDVRYPEHLRTRAAKFAARADETAEIFGALPELILPKPQGAFYYPIVFKDGVLNGQQKLPIDRAPTREIVENIVQGVADDKRFAYYLMGAEGICVTPLSGFHTPLNGFRLTLLRDDDDLRRATFRRIADAITRYVK
ncbi:MAG: pyridoxal phosphate-dependent aminotransferase [Planctomycetota bacterium]|jgi:aspartate/methionine/tyrosine aminotransferase|nr:pyridoxal phosphate-dependent aminotransferase [Planctomycetota bacterium]